MKNGDAVRLLGSCQKAVFSLGHVSAPDRRLTQGTDMKGLPVDS